MSNLHHARQLSHARNCATLAKRPALRRVRLEARERPAGGTRHLDAAAPKRRRKLCIPGCAHGITPRAARGEPAVVQPVQVPALEVAPEDRGDLQRVADDVDGAVVREAVERARVGEVLEHAVVVDVARDHLPRQRARRRRQLHRPAAADSAPSCLWCAFCSAFSHLSTKVDATPPIDGSTPRVMEAAGARRSWPSATACARNRLVRRECWNIATKAYKPSAQAPEPRARERRRREQPEEEQSQIASQPSTARRACGGGHLHLLLAGVAWMSWQADRAQANSRLTRGGRSLC